MRSERLPTTDESGEFGSDFAEDVTAAPNGDFLSIEQIYHYDDDGYVNNPGQVVRINGDDYTETVWSIMDAEIDGANFQRGMIRTARDGRIFIGGRFSANDVTEDRLDIHSSSLEFLGSSGSIPVGSTIDMRGVEEDADGNLYLYGSTWNSVDGIDAPHQPGHTSYSNGFLRRMTENGTWIDTQIFADPTTGGLIGDFVADIAPGEGNNMHLVGTMGFTTATDALMTTAFVRTMRLDAAP